MTSNSSPTDRLSSTASIEEAPQLFPSFVTSRLGLNALLHVFLSCCTNHLSRGLQLSVVGTYRALQNPDLYLQFKEIYSDFSSFTQDHYRQAAYAVVAGLSLYLILLLPLFLIRAVVWTSSLFVDINKSKWDIDLINGGGIHP